MELPASATVTTCYLALQSLSTSASPALNPAPDSAHNTFGPGAIAIEWVTR